VRHETDHEADNDENHGSYDVYFCLRQTSRRALTALAVTGGPGLRLTLADTVVSLISTTGRAIVGHLYC